MKTKALFISLLVFVLPIQKLFADSPLTSTDFSRAYQSEFIVSKAQNAEGELNPELAEYLIDKSNPIDLKLALINELGWEISGRSNAEFFMDYLKLKGYFNSESDFLKKGDAGQLICYAYLMAMDDYFDVKRAHQISKIAKSKNKRSYSIHLIAALIEAQDVMDSGWCAVFLATDKVKKNKRLKRDMKPEASAIIFEYMDLYKENCG